MRRYLITSDPELSKMLLSALTSGSDLPLHLEIRIPGSRFNGDLVLGKFTNVLKEKESVADQNNGFRI